MFDKIVIGFVLIPALLHMYFMYLEMFLWEKPRTLKAFGMTPEYAKQTRALAFNQGIYNGFLAAGLIWSFFLNNLDWSRQVQLFFLGCIFIAGIVGGKTVSKRIFYVQSVPAFVPMVMILLN